MHCKKIRIYCGTWMDLLIMTVQWLVITDRNSSTAKKKVMTGTYAARHTSAGLWLRDMHNTNKGMSWPQYVGYVCVYTYSNHAYTDNAVMLSTLFRKLMDSRKPKILSFLQQHHVWGITIQVIHFIHVQNSCLPNMQLEKKKFFHLCLRQDFSCVKQCVF